MEGKLAGGGAMTDGVARRVAFGTFVLVLSIVIGPQGAALAGESADSGRATGVTWVPTSPEIGELTTFTITGHSGDIRAEWNFGESGCPGYPQIQVCDPIYSDCHDMAFKFASGGAKNVTVTVKDPSSGTTLGSTGVTVNVQYAGSCGGTCTYSIFPTSRSFTEAGGTGTVDVMTQPGCTWTASESASWIAITSGSSGNGSGTVTYQVAANTGGARSATITAAGRSHIVSQTSGTGCSVTIDPVTSLFPWQGGSGAVKISAAPDCGWVASPTDPWIVLTSPSFGTGPSSLTYDVDENGGPPRTGTVFIGDKIHTVDQDEVGPCGRGAVPDDDLPENGYGWGTANLFVQQFTPDAYPFVYTDVCVAFTQAGGDSTLDFDVVVFDDDGPGGGPGTLIGAVASVASGVPPWLDHSFATVDVEGAVPAIQEGSVYIGVGWDEGAELGFYVAADESPGTPQQVGYFSSGGAPWQNTAGAFPGYRSLLLRADGFASVDGDWTQVVGSIFGGGNGFGDMSNSRVEAAATFGNAMFAGTGNALGAEVMITTNGVDWSWSSDPGFGNPTNTAVSNLISFDGALYATTHNEYYGAQVWSTASPPSWTPVALNGFSDPWNTSVPSGAVFEGSLYLGTENAAGCELWRLSNGTSWSQTHTDGFGDSGNVSATAMAVFDGQLYVATENAAGTEIWRSPDGIVWFQVADGGFGSSDNTAAGDLIVYQDELYCGVSNATTGAQVWRTTDGTGWSPVVTDGFGDPTDTEFGDLEVGDVGLLASVSGPSAPGTIWQSTDGTSWSSSTTPGFGDIENTSIGTLIYWNDRVYAGTTNTAAGCEIWRSGRHPLFEDGFENGNLAGWGVSVP